MQFFLNGRRAWPVDGQTFDFVARNPLFVDDGKAEGFSFEIVFGLEWNRDVFGHVERADCVKPTDLMDCCVVDDGLSLRGALCVTEVTESRVTGQFLEGVRADVDDVPADVLFVDELDLGEAPETDPSKVAPMDARRGVRGAVCYPWLAEGFDVVNNLAVGDSAWHEETRRLTWMLPLLEMCRRIGEAAGLEVVIPESAEAEWGDALVCNQLPPSWRMPGFARALPHWTVREWFAKLGPFMRGVWILDVSAGSVRFVSYGDYLSEGGFVSPDVEDEYSAEVARDEEDAGFAPVKVWRYGHRDDGLWKYQDCPWIRESGFRMSVFESMDDLLENGGSYVYDDAGHRVDGNYGPLYYVRDIDTLFTSRPFVRGSAGLIPDAVSGRFPYLHGFELVPVDCFGPSEWSEDGDIEYETLDFVPVCVDWVMEGKVMQLPVGQLSESEGRKLDVLSPDLMGEEVTLGHGIALAGGYVASDSLVHGVTRLESAIVCHEDGKESSAFFDCVYVGFRNPEAAGSESGAGNRPYPLTDFDVYGNRLAGHAAMRLRGEGAGIGIDPRVRYCFRFVWGQGIPPRGAVYCFHGQRFVCSELEVRLGGDGRRGERLVKGYFYRLS